MKKLFSILTIVFLISFFGFAAILPYPILSRYTNITEKQMSSINNFHETEMSQIESENISILTISWDDGINMLLENDQPYEVYDTATKQYFKIKRIGGKNHADVVPASQEDFEFINQNLTKTCNPVVLIYNSSTLIPASFASYMHGYSDQTGEFFGHYCLYFKDSKTHQTQNADYYHQKAVKTAQRQAQALLID